MNTNVCPKCGKQWQAPFKSNGECTQCVSADIRKHEQRQRERILSNAVRAVVLR